MLKQRKKNGRLKNVQQEVRLFQHRVCWLVCFILICALAMFIRLYQLQIQQQHYFRTLSTENRISIMPLLPQRGEIYDRNGYLLAGNKFVFSLKINPLMVHDLPKTLKQLSKIIHWRKEEQEAFFKTINRKKRFFSSILKANLSAKEMALFSVNAYRFPGVHIEKTPLRYYPFKEVTGFITGYLGVINAKDLQKVISNEYIADHYIGKTGIERYYEQLLHGHVGYQKIETNASGKPIRKLSTLPAQAGKDLYLSIDIRLQRAAMRALKPYQGAAVVIDPNNGEILALASQPAFDPNRFVSGISQKSFQQLMHDKKRPLFHRAIQGLYPPASALKPFVALAGLNNKVITTKTTIKDQGSYQIKENSHIYQDWDPKGHGLVNLYKAIVLSCDTFFYQLATKLGIKNMDSMLKQFGFGQYTNIDVPQEKKGILASPQWKKNHIHERWYGGDTVISAIGQGFMLATPLQLASAVATLAKHGIAYQPHLLIKVAKGKKIQIIEEKAKSIIRLKKQSYWTNIIAAMTGVIKDPWGTGFRFGHPPYPVAAKTGTAQLINRENQKNTNNPLDHHLFIAFAPVKKPRIAVAVVLEYNHRVPTVARKIIDTYMVLTQKIRPDETQDEQIKAAKKQKDISNVAD